MKSRITSTIAAAELGLVLVAGAYATTMLWFGNSYTEAGKQWAMLPMLINCTSSCGMNEPSGMTIDITTEIVPSCWLGCHEAGGAFAKIDQGHFDLVFAQDNLAGWLWRDYSYGDNLADKTDQLGQWANQAQAAGSRLVIEQMWIALGVPDHCDETQQRSDWWYDSIATATNSILVPAGHAWYAAYQERPDLEYIDPNWNDGCHPGAFGAYLNICAQYAGLTGKSPVGATWHNVDMGGTVTLSDDEALFAQQKAWEAYLYFNGSTRAVQRPAPAITKRTGQPTGNGFAMLFDIKGRMINGKASSVHNGRGFQPGLMIIMNGGEITRHYSGHDKAFEQK